MIRYENSMKLVKKETFERPLLHLGNSFSLFYMIYFKKDCPHVIFVHNETQATAVKRCPQCELLNW